MKLTGANTHNSRVFEEMVDSIEPIRRPEASLAGPVSALCSRLSQLPAMTVLIGRPAQADAPSILFNIQDLDIDHATNGQLLPLRDPAAV